MENSQKEIIKKIKELKNIQPRLEWQTLNRDFLLSQIREKQVTTVALGWKDYFSFVTQVIRQRVLLEPAVMILLVLGFSVGSSLVVNAAFYSLPGDPLYKMKIALENTQLAITPDEAKQVELKIEFAQKRVAELDKIFTQSNVTSEVKQERINLVIKELQRNVVAVKQHVDKVSLQDKGTNDADLQKTLKMAVSISQKTEELAKSLDKKVEGMSESENIRVGNLVQETVQSVQAVNQTAQDVISQVQQQTDTQIQNSTSSPQVESAEFSEGGQGIEVIEQTQADATTTVNIQTVDVSNSNNNTTTVEDNSISN